MAPKVIGVIGASSDSVFVQDPMGTSVGCNLVRVGCHLVRVACNLAEPITASNDAQCAPSLTAKNSSMERAVI